MKLILAMIVLWIFLPFWAGADDDLKVGLGLRTSFLGYNQDELDTSQLFWGAHARLRLMKYFAGEASLQRRKDEFSFHEGEIVFETTPLQLSAVVYPLAMLPVTPYLLAGTGWYFFTISVSGDLGLPYVAGEGSIEITQNAPHIGVGVEGFIGDHFSVGGDVRKIFLDIETPIIDYKFDAYFVNVGVTFYF